MLITKENSPYDRWWGGNLRKKRRCQPWIQANYEVCLLEEKLEKTDCDRRNKKSRTFSSVPADLHLSFKQIYFIKQFKFKFRSLLELDIHFAGFPSLWFFFFGLAYYLQMQIPEGKLSGDCSSWPVNFCNSLFTGNLRYIFRVLAKRLIIP